MLSFDRQITIRKLYNIYLLTSLYGVLNMRRFVIITAAVVGLQEAKSIALIQTEDSHVSIVIIIITRSELASLAHSFYTCMKLRINLLK